jgi:hypothetical protein
MKGVFAACIILSAALLISAFVVGGRFDTVAQQRGGVYVVDRFTGHASFCLPAGCTDIPPKYSN